MRWEIMKDMQIHAKYREAVEEFVRRVSERYRDKIESITLFGSVARGEDKEGRFQIEACAYRGRL